ncbi:Membrane-bound O-acyltransferase domain-containing protein 2 [Blattella germanica]|nr:Membrane-bound O-acyltransferase domain-containing protein 2 [Blattella germanica]
MVITQKVTSLAFHLHDGLTRPEEELTADQKYHVVRKMPTALEYFSYMFHFQGLMCGPIIFYRDYIDFIHGHSFLKHASSSSAQIDNNLNSNKVVLEPSPYLVVFKKVVGSVLCAVIFLYLIPIFPLERIKESEFVEETSIVSKLFYLGMVTTIVRFKYYHAWLLADAICNASGLGFNGFDAKGNARWDLISNVDVFKFELGLSMRDSIEQWNKGTTRWLRMVVYERTTKYRTLLTYALSALWHGFYPGYYLTFMSGALFTSAARSVRRSVRHYFVHSKQLKFLYDVATMLTTRVVMAYITFSFVLLEFWPSVQLFLHMYLFLHVLGILALWLLPIVMPPPRRTPESEKPGPSSNGVIPKEE